MSTASATQENSGHRSGVNWAPWLIAFGLGAALVIAFWAYNKNFGGDDFNWIFILPVLIGMTFMVLGYQAVKDADSEHGTFGGMGNCVGIGLFLVGALIVAAVIVPPSWLGKYQEIAYPLKKQFSPKPHVVPTAEPALAPKLEWFKVELPVAKVGTTPPAAATTPSSSTNVFVQIKMPLEDAKKGFPALQSSVMNRGSVVVWYEDGAKESRTDDY